VITRKQGSICRKVGTTYIINVCVKTIRSILGGFVYISDCMLARLIAVSQATHTRHDAEHVVVGGEGL